MKADFVFGLENAGWPVLLVDGSINISRANSAAVRLFGPALGGDYPQLSIIWSRQNGNSAEKFLDHWERAPVPSAHLKFQGKGGETLPFLVAICAFFKDGEKNFLLQLLPEAPSAAPPAEEKRAVPESALAHKQKLDCALQLARTVALDFNNALTAILGHVSYLLATLEPNHPWRNALLEIEKSAAKAAELANDLGAFSRQEKETRTQAAGNLNPVLQRVVEILRQNPSAAQIDWKLQLERKLFTAKFDEAKLQQAFIKIIENSLQALSGSGAGRITIQSRNVELKAPSQDRNVPLAPGAYVIVEITDNGEGISAETLPRIFEPFFTTKGPPHRGLGLAWVYGIVTNHGGGVAVSSQPGTGTSVRVYLPAQSRVVRESETRLQDLTGSQTILLVDDDDLVLNMGRMVLSASGYRALTARSGEEALEVLSRGEKIDLVITDLVMPSMSGSQLIERILQEAPNTRIICTSGYGWQSAKEPSAAYLRKPFTSQELLVKVKEALAG